MKLDTISILTDEVAQTLVDKHIHFTWHQKDHTLFTLPGKVLNYKDGILLIDTLDIIYDEKPSKQHGNINENVANIGIDNIRDVFVFERYTKHFWELLEPINESDINKKMFKIEDIYGNSIVSKILREDVLSITITIDDEPYDYPIYFIRSIEPLNKLKK